MSASCVKTVLVTGGAGYIGSHTCLALLERGVDVVVVDNLTNSSSQSLERVTALTGKDIAFHKLDLRDAAGLAGVLAQHRIDACIHFAGLKAVGESTRIPLQYYQNNLEATLTLVQELRNAGVKKLLFSSSATVYGDPVSVPIPEDAALHVTNPYGRTKLMSEEILRDVHAADQEWSIVLLRYFNPVGAHKSGLIGEDPLGEPNNLVPYISQVAVGRLAQLRVFGNDYPTPDGTGVRDYIHVMDLAEGHSAAMQCLAEPGFSIFNLGTGSGHSVLEVLHAFEQVCGHAIPYVITPRRPGDIATCLADPGKAEKELGWKTCRGLDEMLQDAWNWQTKNPRGYEDV